MMTLSRLIALYHYDFIDFSITVYRCNQRDATVARLALWRHVFEEFVVVVNSS